MVTKLAQRPGPPQGRIRATHRRSDQSLIGLRSLRYQSQSERLASAYQPASRWSQSPLLVVLWESIDALVDLEGDY